MPNRRDAIKTSQHKKQKSLWSKWFPFPGSWLRALCVLLWVGIVLRIAGFWGVLLGITTSRMVEDPKLLLYFLGAALLAALLVFSYSHHFLWGKPVKRWHSWLPTPLSLWEGLYALVVLTIAVAVAFICVMPFHDWKYYDTPPTNTELNWLAGIWSVTAAYLYQVEYLIRKHLASTARSPTPRQALAEGEAQR